jgi:hypothetical protein
MLRWSLNLTLTLILLAVASISFAQKPAEPAPSADVSRFVMGTRLGYITCSEKYRSYLEKWELYALMTEGQRQPKGTPPSDSEVADCIHQTALRGASLYKEALKGADAPKVRAAYSEYMTAWDQALKGIRRPERESVQQYRARQKKVEERLDALQTRLESAVPGA